jgi:hypothetical protein
MALHVKAIVDLAVTTLGAVAMGHHGNVLRLAIEQVCTNFVKFYVSFSHIFLI